MHCCFHGLSEIWPRESVWSSWYYRGNYKGLQTLFFMSLLLLVFSQGKTTDKSFRRKSNTVHSERGFIYYKLNCLPPPGTLLAGHWQTGDVSAVGTILLMNPMNKEEKVVSGSKCNHSSKWCILRSVQDII